MPSKAMPQLFSRPDRYVGRCGHLDCRVTETVIPEAPAFLRGLRALFVCDVHAITRTTDEDIRALRRHMLDLAPELILMGGDYADRPEHCARLFEVLSPLAAPLGCYGVAGNNDREAWPELDALRHIMAKAGATLLVNEAVSIPRGDGTLILAGLDEYRHGDPKAEGLYPAAPVPGHYRLLLSHFAKPVEPMPELMLCGHTHGGQFNLLGLTPFTIGFERFSRRGAPSHCIAGMCRVHGGRMLVSKGIGASRIQLRVGVQPEINLLVFR